MIKQTQKNSINKKWFFMGLVGLVAIGLGGGYIVSSYFGNNDDNDTIKDLSLIKGGETRPTLSPVRFTGRTAAAYQIAQEIPEVLDHLHCYCECKKHFKHKSLLTCYIDEHGSHCDVCIDEAIRAYELFKQGVDILSIRKAIDKEFSKHHLLY